MGRRFERTILVLVVCVPVPAFALSGLAIPLPGVVERIGAALVPWADAATLDTHSLAASTTRGTIVLTPGQRTSTTVDVETTGATGRRTFGSARLRVSGPLLSRTNGATTDVQADTSGASTPGTVPTAPVDPHGDGGESESPVPAPAPVGPSHEPGGGDAPPTTTPTTTPNADPVPDREPKEEPDVKPLDPDVKPADDTDVTPPEPVPPVPADPPADPDVKPDTKPVDELGHPSRDAPRNGEGANESATAM